MQIRDYQASDLDALFTINQAGVPGVGAETRDSLGKWIGLSRCLVAVKDGAGPVGLITLLPPGTTEYDSKNLRWLEAHYAPSTDFIYVDRIAISEAGRGNGIGGALYAAAFHLYAPKVSFITCEINKAPPNPGSMRFHKRLGFEVIGERDYQYAGETRAIYYLQRALG